MYVAGLIREMSVIEGAAAKDGMCFHPAGLIPIRVTARAVQPAVSPGQ